MSLTQITPETATTVGPYSPAIVSGNTVYCSGQLAFDSTHGTLVGEDVGAQTAKALENLAALLAAAGTSLSRVAKTTVYLIDLHDFGSMNQAYAEAFGDHKPARVTVEVSALPLGARVQIDCVAILDVTAT